MAKKKILIVDDEEDILHYLKKRLERAGFNVFTASCGRECLEIANSHDPDLVLLDIIMPFMDGYEVIKKLRESSKTKYTPILMHSVRKETKSIFKCIELGSVDYITKPVSFEELLRVIRRYV
jgi:DNA-binding response OmpR family regulator